MLLARIPEAFVAKELQPWTKTFPDEYHAQLFRLRGLEYRADSGRAAQYFETRYRERGRPTEVVGFAKAASALKPAHYIVTEAQKEALIAVIPARHSLLFATLLTAWCVMCGIGGSHLASISAHQPTMNDHLGIMIAAGVPYYVATVVMIRNRSRRMAPLLASAARAR